MEWQQTDLLNPQVKEHNMELPDDFQFRLAQWLLDQLKSDRDLEIVAQQFSLLISQTQDQSFGDLYSHIGGLIAQRAVGTPVDKSKDDIRLCAELCYCLYSIHFEQRSSRSPRVLFIHERLFEQCISSFSIKSAIQSTSTQESNESLTGLGATSPSEDSKISIKKNSELLFHLFNFQLLSLAQISEYVFRVIEGHGASIGTGLSDAMAGVRLLVGLFPGRSRGPWQKEANSFSKWIDQHTISDKNQANAAMDQSGEPHNITMDGNNLTHKSTSSSSNEGDSLTPGTHVIPISLNETDHPPQSHAHEEDETNNTTGNNLGRPPRTPATSRAESPVDARPEDKVPAVIETGTENQETSSMNILVSPLESTRKPKDENTPWVSITTSEVTTIPLPTTKTASTTPFFDSASGPSHPSPTLSHPPSNLPVLSALLPGPLQPTTLHTPRALFPLSSNNVPTFSSTNFHHSTNSEQNSNGGSTLEGQVTLLLKLPSTETEEQKNKKLGQEEKEKAIREKKDRDRMERENIEEKKRAEAERQETEEGERKVREEAICKAEEERKLIEEAMRKEELQAAERRAIEAAKQKAEEDRAARVREEAERKAEEKRRVKEEAKRKKEELQAKLEAERKAEEHEASKEVTRKAKDEAEHKAKVDKMREEMEKLAKREAEIKAKREKERKAREEEERKEMEKKAKEDKARVDKMRQDMERMFKKEAELKAKKEAEHKAKVDKMREEMEQMTRREAELRARREQEERKEIERKAWEEEEEAKTRRQAELKAQRMAKRQAKKESKRKAREATSIEVPAPPEAPAKWDLNEEYDFPPRDYNPYMYAGGLSEPAMPFYFRPSSSAAQAGLPCELPTPRNSLLQQFYPTYTTTPQDRPRAPSPSLNDSDFPELPSSSSKPPKTPPAIPPKRQRVLRLVTEQQ
ncbi:hypothetical protein B0J17DRAFT_722523 [Rhizoctonia solani]|nr:hypothetical protein B0J17DRAFT_722523 [Rhizoctonia solani]